MYGFPTDKPTDIHISREISIEHPSVGLTSLAQLSSKFNVLVFYDTKTKICNTFNIFS